MINNVKILKGNIIFTMDKDEFTTLENGYIIVIDNVVKGTFSELPSEYTHFEITDYSDNLIIPGLVDLHLHAPQYENMGLGLDKELLPWLETYTFPEESKFSNEEYAQKVYGKFVHDLWENGTTRSVIFATIHKNSTEILFDMLLKNNLSAYVGKVNMDRNCHEDLKESTEKSISDTEEFVKKYNNVSKLVKPIITPRFVPHCSDELMRRLSKISKDYNTPIQSHLSENKGEISWVKELYPDILNYGRVYDKFGLFGDVKTIMAHCVHCTDDEVNLMKDKGVYVAHCPVSNFGVSSGIAPIKYYLLEGLNMGLGTDISGGYSISMLRTIVTSIEASKMYSLYVNNKYGNLSISESFYLATKGGGSFFGKVGSFEEGYEFDALVIDDSDIKGVSNRTVKERLEKFIYIGKSSNIIKRYVSGKLIDELIL